ncbi:uncharacterized protein LOC142098480 [Mixophyes fleayi]|uniref:uncharacterized protein LOC142098480 n=1 Tax=Mixophyes fleayi TaxID=3061075 RepID=UPI003F4D9135
MRQDIYSVFKKYLQTDTSCKLTESVLQRTSRSESQSFREPVVQRVSRSESQSFREPVVQRVSRSETSAIFSGDPTTLAMVATLDLTEDLKIYYAQLLATENPKFPLQGIPKNILCYAIGELNISITTENENQTNTTLGLLKTCNITNGTNLGTELENITSITPTKLADMTITANLLSNTTFTGIILTNIKQFKSLAELKEYVVQIQSYVCAGSVSATSSCANSEVLSNSTKETIFSSISEVLYKYWSPSNESQWLEDFTIITRMFVLQMTESTIQKLPTNIGCETAEGIVTSMDASYDLLKSDIQKAVYQYLFFYHKRSNMTCDTSGDLQVFITSFFRKFSAVLSPGDLVSLMPYNQLSVKLNSLKPQDLVTRLQADSNVNSTAWSIILSHYTNITNLGHVLDLLSMKMVNVSATVFSAVWSTFVSNSGSLNSSEMDQWFNIRFNDSIKLITLEELNVTGIMDASCLFYGSLVKALSTHYQDYSDRMRQDIYSVFKKYLQTDTSCKLTESVLQRTSRSESQSFREPVIQRVSRSESQSFRESVVQRVSRSESQSFRESVVQRVSRSESQSFREPVVQRASRSESQSFRESVVQRVSRSESQSFRESVVQRASHLESQSVIHRASHSESQSFRDTIIQRISHSETQSFRESVIQRTSNLERQSFRESVIQRPSHSESPTPRCYTAGNDSWIVYYLQRYLTYCSATDLESFSSNETLLQQFSVDPTTLAMVATLDLTEDLKIYYAQLLATENPKFPLQSIPKNILCYAIGELNISITTENENQTNTTLGLLKTCNITNGTNLGTELENITSITPTKLADMTITANLLSNTTFTGIILTNIKQFKSLAELKEYIVQIQSYVCAGSVSATSSCANSEVLSNSTKETIFSSISEVLYKYWSPSNESQWLEDFTIITRMFVLQMTESTIQKLPTNIGCETAEGIVTSMDASYDLLKSDIQKAVYQYLFFYHKRSNMTCDTSGDLQVFITSFFRKFSAVLSPGDLVSLMPYNQLSVKLNSLKPQDLVTHLQADSNVNSTAWSIILSHYTNITNLGHVLDLLSMKMVNVSATVFSAVWSTFVSNSGSLNSSEMDQWFNIRFNDSIKLITLEELNATGIMDASCLFYGSLVKALSTHYQDYSDSMRQDIYSVFKKYLQTGPTPRCYTAGNDSWIVYYLQRYLTYCSATDLESFSSNETLLQQFSVDPTTLAMVATLDLTEDLKIYYAQLLATENPKFPLQGIPKNILCYAIGKLNISITTENENQTNTTLGLLKTCNITNGTNLGTELENITSITPTKLADMTITANLLSNTTFTGIILTNIKQFKSLAELKEYIVQIQSYVCAGSVSAMSSCANSEVLSNSTKETIFSSISEVLYKYWSPSNESQWLEDFTIIIRMFVLQMTESTIQQLPTNIGCETAKGIVTSMDTSYDLLKSDIQKAVYQYLFFYHKRSNMTCDTSGDLQVFITSFFRKFTAVLSPGDLVSLMPYNQLSVKLNSLKPQDLVTRLQADSNVNSTAWSIILSHYTNITNLGHVLDLLSMKMLSNNMKSVYVNDTDTYN